MRKYNIVNFKKAIKNPIWIINRFKSKIFSNKFNLKNLQSHKILMNNVYRDFELNEYLENKGVLLLDQA